MNPGLPDIVILAGRLRSEVEQAVRGFPRFHKYSSGLDLRQQILQVEKLANRAWRDRPRQPYWTDQLIFAIDDFKSSLQCAKNVKAFLRFEQFEALARLASELGRRCGGWRKRQQQNGQNGANPSGSRQRANNTEFPAASLEANS
jgi:hypothetical protein